MDKPIPITSMARGKVIGKTLLKIGATHSKGALKKILSSENHKQSIQDETHEETAKIIIEALGELKGISVKIAQQVMVALPFLPQNYLEHIGKSFNAVPPINRALIRKIIKQELGSYPEEIFESFEAIPFGSASLGQVHKAKYKGETVAVKVQYPGIANSIHSDMGMVKFMLERFAKGHNIDHLIEEINRRLYEEVDYCFEADNVMFFKNAITHPNIVIPRAYKDLSTSKVLVCSCVEGYSLIDFLTSKPTQTQRNHYAQILFDTFFSTLYELKAIHADPNPGNFIFMQNGDLGVIDFGCIKYVDQEFLTHYNHLHLSLIYGENEDEIVRQYANLKMIDQSDIETMRAFYQEIIRPLDSLYIEILKEDYYDFGADHSFSKRGFETILDIQKKQTHSVHKFNQEYLFLNRTLLGYYTLFEQMNAQIDTRFAKTVMKTFQGENNG
ncbi:ABC1 kinase family protein [Sulfurospirillum cavolei]|uniref:ABC1 kinase family protein n=1 Tax=Sulfurospirillum cavolei TaxID=366522 RepID=UPI0007649049|nr:AarF/ABC1/UbiB kinase family protein [Sulfurospirillum cavolei]